MNYALLVLAPPCSSQGNSSALKFAQAVLARGHQLSRVFFYGDGVYTGTRLGVAPQDEASITDAWAELASEHKTELFVCVGASLRRDIVDDKEASRYRLPASSLHPAFEITGLGQLVDAGLACDRLLTFTA